MPKLAIPLILVAVVAAGGSGAEVDEEIVDVQVVPMNLLEDGSESARATRLREEGFLYVDRFNGESFQRLEGCKYRLVQRLSDGSLVTTDLRFACDARPQIRTDVSVDGSIYNYGVSIENKVGATDLAASVRIPVASDDFAAVADLPKGWRALPQEEWTILFPLNQDSHDEIANGASLRGVFSSSYLPGLVEILVTSAAREAPELLKEELVGPLNEVVMQEKANRTQWKIVAVAPGIKPVSDVYTRTEAVERLREDTALALKSGMINEISSVYLLEALRAIQEEPTDRARHQPIPDELEGMGGVDPLYLNALRLTFEHLSRN